MPQTIDGVGLGLRAEFIEQLRDAPWQPDFLEIAPENWIDIGGRRGEQLAYYTQQYPMVAHGLSLSIGGPMPFDKHYLLQLKNFLNQHHVQIYSEHLSYCSDRQGYLYDLMPLPFTQESVAHVAARIKQVQETLERRIALENISYYLPPSTELSESEFINAVLTEADCDLLLDVNNIYVNSINHNYDANTFLKSLPLERVAYVHIAGHFKKSEDLIIDSHGADVINPVWDLLKFTYERMGVQPTLLERDFNVPPLETLSKECQHIQALQRAQSQVA